MSGQAKRTKHSSVKSQRKSQPPSPGVISREIQALINYLSVRVS